ncbi:MAG: hypothetical protein K8R23_06510 [Chthoniobacter sp.]|nr:hypothetical protein [Chthoniobacter sp.]
MTNLDSGSKTASKAAKLLASKGVGYVVPTAKQKKSLVVACAKQGKIVYGKAFDVVRVTGKVNLDSLEDIEARLAQILFCEIKSTKKKLDGEFKGYFFGISAAEVLVAQNLKEQFRFIFVNTITGAHLELKLNEVFARARGIYPTWSISF